MEETWTTACTECHSAICSCELRWDVKMMDTKQKTKKYYCTTSRSSLKPRLQTVLRGIGRVGGANRDRELRKRAGVVAPTVTKIGAADPRPPAAVVPARVAVAESGVLVLTGADTPGGLSRVCTRVDKEEEDVEMGRVCCTQDVGKQARTELGVGGVGGKKWSLTKGEGDVGRRGGKTGRCERPQGLNPCLGS